MREGWIVNISRMLLLPLIVCGLFSGCTITPDGVEENEVLLPAIFPPSKTVASYRQLKKPKQLKKKELAKQFGEQVKVDILKKWGAFTSMSCEYGLPKRDPKVRVSVTEMTTKMDAYGAYTNLRPGLLKEKQYVKIGVSGTLDGERLLFMQDRYIVVVLDLGKTPADQRRALLINFGKKISDRIPRAVTDVDPVTFLPYSHRVPASERLDKDDPLGLDILKRGTVTALYRFEGRECKVFLTEVATSKKRNRTLKKLRAALRRDGPLTEISIGDIGFSGKLFKKRCMVAQRKNIVFGAYGTMTEKEMMEMVATIDRRIKPFIPKNYKDKDGDEGKGMSGDALYE